METGRGNAHPAAQAIAARGNKRLSIAANDQHHGAKPYESIILAWRDGVPVRLGDVAKVFDSVESERVAAGTDGTRSISVMIHRQPGANIIDVIERSCTSATEARIDVLRPSVTLTSIAGEMERDSEGSSAPRARRLHRPGGAL